MPTEKQIEAALRAYWGDMPFEDGQRDAMRSAIEAAEAAGWEPIESVPFDKTVHNTKFGRTSIYQVGDGRPVLVAATDGVDSGYMDILSFCTKGPRSKKITAERWGFYPGVFQMTHWRPLPTPPEVSK